MKVGSAVVALGVLGLMGCGGGSSSEPTGRMSVTLVDGPIDGFEQINLDIQSVEIRGAGGWITLGTPNKVVNLLDLTGGVTQTLASGATLPAGTYGQMRLILGPNNTLKPVGQALQALKVPSGLQTGVKLIVNFQVEAGSTKDVWIDFDAARSVQPHQTGNGSWMLRPTVWAYDKVATGSISGTLSSGGSPVAGAWVTAQVLENGSPRVIRRALSSATGSYQLDLLPLGIPYFVVSQPVVGTNAYSAQASGALTLTGSAPLATANFVFQAASATGSVSGSFQSPAGTDQHDEVELLQSLPSGAATYAFVVRGTNATVTPQGESYGFSLLPSAGYQARATRWTLAPDGSLSGVPTLSPTFTVNGGQTTTVNF